MNPIYSKIYCNYNDIVNRTNHIRKNNLMFHLGPDWCNIVEGTDFDSDDASIERYMKFFYDYISSFDFSKESNVSSTTDRKNDSPEKYRENLRPELKAIWEKIVSGEIDINSSDNLRER